MDIDGLGPAVLEQLVQAELVHSPADLYRLTAEDVIALDRKAEKSAGNLIAAIEKSKQNELYRLVFALGIRNIGLKAAKLICENFLTIDDIMNAAADDFAKIDGFGAIMAKSVESYFRLEGTVELISQLKALGLQMKPSEQKPKGGVFEGKTFVLTGTLPTMKRSEASKLVEQNGGKTRGRGSGQQADKGADARNPDSHGRGISRDAAKIRIRNNRPVDNGRSIFMPVRIE